MEAVEEGHGAAPFYRLGNGEPRGGGGETAVGAPDNRHLSIRIHPVIA
jgi:hypothetical protein